MLLYLNLCRRGSRMACVFDKSLIKGAHIGFQSKRSVRYFQTLTDVGITYHSNSNIKTSCDAE